MPFCYKCGAQIGEGDRFCNKCGTKVGEQIISQPVVSPTVGTSGVAIAALVLGLLGFPLGWFLGLVPIGAIICGLVGIQETGIGKKGGRGMAIAGLALGCVTLLGWAMLISMAIIFWD